MPKEALEWKPKGQSSRGRHKKWWMDVEKENLKTLASGGLERGSTK